jgi:hypothetical protein
MVANGVEVGAPSRWAGCELDGPAVSGAGVTLNLEGAKDPAGDPMNDQVAIMLVLSAMCACSVAFALMLPRLAAAVGRGRISAAARVSAVMAVLVVVTLAAAAVLGASPVAYSIVI